MKRFFDLFVILLSLPLLLPLVALVAFLVRNKLGSPVLFSQKRPGLQGKPFDMIKFRSMTEERNQNGELLPDAVRLTPFGKVLRATSLDELPELWNVFRGDMSLVGPRPLLMEYLPLYSKEQRLRHEVLPGVTGWAQINGRNAIGWEEKFALDVWYVKNRSFFLDLDILWKTAQKVISRDDISSATEVTMSKFTGSGQKNLAIIGASGHGKVVADIARLSGWENISFFDQKWPEETRNGDADIVGNSAGLIQRLSEFDGVIVAIGNSKIRAFEQQKIIENRGSLATVIHPAASLSPSVQTGDGVVIMAGAVINADAVIGDGCIINSNAVVEHDCLLKDYVHIAPAAALSGNCTIGTQSWVGVGAALRQGSVIGNNVMVGAGAVVIGTIDDNLTVAGCPAKPL